MSKPGTIYRLTHQCFDPTDDIQEIVDISDNDNLIPDDEDADIIDLIPAGEPVMCSVIDTDEKPFTVVKSEQLTISLHSDNPVNMNTFASGSDNRWSVHNYIGAKTLFKGFLVLDDMSEPFMPEPNEVVLTATDALGLLREIPLVDADGLNPVGEYKIIEFLKMALDKTGLSLGIKASFNIKNAGFIDDISIPNANDQHFFSLNYLNAKTFEDEIGSSISCREVIEIILGQEACLFQRQGYWWILRIDEIEHPTRGLYITEWDADGVFVGNLGEKSFNKDIGKDAPYTIFFSREQTKVVPTRPNKSAELTFPYSTPLEILENIDFERGDLVTTVSPTEKLYSISDWNLFQNTGTSLGLPGTTARVRRIFENDYEKERYAVVMPGTQQDYYLASMTRIPVGEKDRFEFSVDVSYNDADVYTGGVYSASVAQIRLYASDGTFYTFDGGVSIDPTPQWVECTSNFSTNQQYFVIEGDGDEDDRQWKSVSQYGNVSNTAMPKAGYIVVILRANFETDTWETRFSNVRFEPIPYINGSYKKYTSQSQKVTQDGEYKAKIEVDVYVSDSPRVVLKGSLLKGLLYSSVFSGSVIFVTGGFFKIAGYQLFLFRKGQRLNISGTTSNNISETRVKGATYSIIGTETIIEIEGTTVNETDASTLVQELFFELSDEFYNAATAPAGPPDDTYIHPYSEIQVFDVWNQFMNDKRVFQATCQGLDLSALDSDLEINNAHLIHKWSFTDINENTIDRFFQLLTFDQSHRTAEWTGTFREVYNLTREKSYLGRTFQYNT